MPPARSERSNSKPPASREGSVAGAPATCMLLVGDRVILRAWAPPEAEYALFEIADIELRASEPGRVREHGYQTTAGEARARLEQLGITGALARETAATMHPILSEAYARGAAVRHVARYLGPLELFQSEVYGGDEQGYRGVFLELPSLVADLGAPGAGATLQALYLATLLETEADDTTVLLSTDAWTKARKPGTRTHRRPLLANGPHFLAALAELARRAPKPNIVEVLPRADVIAFLRSRADIAPDDDGRALYRTLERAVALRDMPERGPLSDPELWSVEAKIDGGQFDDVIEEIDALELRRGRTPATSYLRARVSLALQLEPPKLIAERMSALALSMTSFQELGLLAAEAWLEAGDTRRALPYARDLVDAQGIDEGLLLRAQRLLARTVGAAPSFADRLRAPAEPSSQPAPRPSRPPPAVTDPPPASAERVRSKPAAGLSVPPLPMPELLGKTNRPPDSAPSSQRARSQPASPSSPRAQPQQAPPSARAQSQQAPPPARAQSEQAPPPARAQSQPVPPSSQRAPSSQRGPLPPPVPPPRRSSKPASSDRMPVAPPANLDFELPPTPDPAASFTLDLPGPNPPSKPPESGPPRNFSQRPAGRISGVTIETRPPARHDPRAEPDTPPERRPTPPRPPPRSSPANPRHEAPTPVLDANLGHDGAARPAPSGRTFMQGASLPPYRLEDPAPLRAKAPLFPKLGSASDELAEHLVLPPGLAAESASLTQVPRSVVEARVQFTLLARELGLDFRLKRGIGLRADVSGIEAMQSVLLESFPDHTIKSVDEAYEVKRCGALLGEILARRLGAEWHDISPNELGYWAMIVPPDMRVWPFGRVARWIAMGHKERDLVSYFLELQSRATPR